MGKVQTILVLFTLSIFANCTYAQSVTIGSQVWMNKNLNVDKFRNGDRIPEAKTYEEWNTAREEGTPAWCYYNNDPINGDKYGKIYNWYAVNDPRGLAPLGWRIAKDDEWTKLISSVGGESKASLQLKAKQGWEKNNNGLNSFGFSALPGGNRSVDGQFEDLSSSIKWWTSTEDEDSYNYAWYHTLGSEQYYERFYGPKECGFYVRCLKDTFSQNPASKYFLFDELKNKLANTNI